MRIPFVLVALLSIVPAPQARAEGKLDAFAVRMVPAVPDARTGNRESWGLAMEAVAPVSGTRGLLAEVVGAEVVNLAVEDSWGISGASPFTYGQETTRDYGRLYFGVQLGPHAGGTIRPYVGLNVAAVWYGAASSGVTFDDNGQVAPGSEVTWSENHYGLGWDANLGFDIQVRNRWNLDFSLRRMRDGASASPSIPGAGPSHPPYFQYRFGIGSAPGE